MSENVHFVAFAVLAVLIALLIWDFLSNYIVPNATGSKA
jgi:membrane protein implicated in regulation of membrane protease activity